MLLWLVCLFDHCYFIVVGCLWLFGVFALGWIAGCLEAC